jgi:hypothetical protein
MQLFYYHQPDEVPQLATLHVEETEWQCRVTPIPFTLRWPNPSQFEQGESPTLETALVFDEWESLVQPVWAYPLPQLFTSDETITAPAAVLGIDEDFPVTTASPIVYALPRVFIVDDEIVPTPPNFDEDFWSNAVAPVWCYPAIVFLADDVIQFASPIQDDYAWQSNIAPAVASNWLQLPYLPDPEEIPAGFLIVASSPTVLGAGEAAMVSGAGSVDTNAGIGAAVLPTGTGRVN